MRNNKIVAFDLDDTLFYEADYLKSAYREIARILDADNDALFTEMCSLYNEQKNVFEYLIKKFKKYSIEDLLTIYRNHQPNITLNKGADVLFGYLKEKGYKIGLITDGRSVTQRNKLKALNIEEEFYKIIISEEFGSTKLSSKNFEVFREHTVSEYFYIADNTAKDFFHPNTLKWKTICLLDKGRNIHKQDFSLVEDFLPQYKIECLTECIDIIK